MGVYMAFEQYDIGMKRAAFNAGIELLVAGEIDTVPHPSWPDNRGGETAKPLSPDLSPPGLGTLMLTGGRFSRDPALAA